MEEAPLNKMNIELLSCGEKRSYHSIPWKCDEHPTTDDNNGQISITKFDSYINKRISSFKSLLILFLVIFICISSSWYYTNRITLVINMGKQTNMKKNVGASSSKQPNFIFVLADDVGFNSLGDRNFLFPSATPNINKLAKEGITMQSYYTQELCSPSRSALLTGRYPVNIGTSYSLVFNCLDTDQKIIPEVFKDYGYDTYLLGKWDLGYQTAKYLPTARGFDLFTGYTQSTNTYWSKQCPSTSLMNYTDFMIANATCYMPYEGPDLLKYSTFFYRDKAIDFINAQSHENPFFMLLSFQAAHIPFGDVKAGYMEGIADDLINSELLEDIKKDVYGDKHKQYWKSISLLDDAVGKIRAALETTGLIDNTYIIFTSDNGGCYLSGGSNGPLRGSKATLFEGGTKVDAIIYSPLFPPSTAGHAYQGLMHVTDWFPSLLALAGIDYQDDSSYTFDGINQVDGWRELATTTIDTGPRTTLLYNWYTNITELNFDLWTNGSMGIRNSRYKLLHTFLIDGYSEYTDPTTTDSILDNDDELYDTMECSLDVQQNSNNFTYFLFDLQEDPFEINNLYYSDKIQHREAKEELYELLFSKYYPDDTVPNCYVVCEDDSYCDSIYQAHNNYIVPFRDVFPSHNLIRTYPSDCYGSTS